MLANNYEMKIRQGVQDLLFFDFNDMFEHLIDLEDHLINIMDKYPEYEIDTLLLSSEDGIYTIRVIIDIHRRRNNEL